MIDMKMQRNHDCYDLLTVRDDTNDERVCILNIWNVDLKCSFDSSIKTHLWKLKANANWQDFIESWLR